MKNLNISRSFWRPIFSTAILTIAVLAVIFASFNLWKYDLRVPMYYDGDTLVILMYVKGLIQDGWPTAIAHLSAPFGYSGAAFPIASSSDWLLIKLLALFSSEPGLITNAFWFLTIVLTAWSATYASYQLGVARAVYFANGLIFAFLPFAMLRNVNHLNLDYYTVPLICLLAIIIAGGEAQVRNARQAKIVGLLACVVQGFNYIYFSYFACVLFVIAAAISYRKGNLSRIKLGVLAVALVCAATAINMIPTVIAWNKDGKPPEMSYKSVAESEVLGAKLRRMLVPSVANPIPLLSEFARRDYAAHFAGENENQSARLGIYGAVGMLLMLWFILSRKSYENEPATSAISSLGLATFLFITVGGFGALINVITVPDIRGLNRFSVFLSFFVISFMGLSLSRSWHARSLILKTLAVLATVLIVPLSLYDQLLDGNTLRRFQKGDTERMQSDRQTVSNMENYFKTRVSVLQMPFTGYPMGVMVEGMFTYDHVRPYLWSQHLNWSWPSLSPAHRAWQARMDSLQGVELINAAVLSGFGAIWIDNRGYKDKGAQLVQGLMRAGATSVDVGNDNFTVLDIRSMHEKLKNDLGDKKFQELADGLLRTPIVDWNHGFYEEERMPNGQKFRWANKNSEFLIKNQVDREIAVCMKFELAPHAVGGTVHVENVDVNIPSKENAVTVKMMLGPKEVRPLHFKTDIPKMEGASEARQLHFKIVDFDMSVCSAESLSRKKIE